MTIYYKSLYENAIKACDALKAEVKMLRGRGEIVGEIVHETQRDGKSSGMIWFKSINAISNHTVIYAGQPPVQNSIVDELVKALKDCKDDLVSRSNYTDEFYKKEHTESALATQGGGTHFAPYIKEQEAQEPTAWCWYNKYTMAFTLGNYCPEEDTFPDNAIDIEPLFTHPQHRTII